MSRVKHRGPRRPGLFTWDTHGQVTPDQTGDHPRARPCPYCGADTGHPCTRGGRGGRVDMAGYHHSRTQETR